ncbi:MAG: DUF86 domain-containing protein [Bacteroidales bacterium]
MSKASHKDFACIVSILDSIEKILDYTTGFKNADEFFEDTKSFDATMMNFVVIGEMADKLSWEIKAQTSGKVDWQRVVGFRNIIAHNYFGIDAEEVWQIIQNRLGGLKEILKDYVD